MSTYSPSLDVHVDSKTYNAVTKDPGWFHSLMKRIENHWNCLIPLGDWEI